MNYLINYIDEPKLYKPDYSFSGQIGAESFTIVLRGLDPILDCRWHSTRQPNPELEWLTEYISTSGLTIQDLAKMTSLQ